MPVFRVMQGWQHIEDAWERTSRSDPLHDCWRVCGWAIRSVRSVPCCSRCQGMTASGPGGLAMAGETDRVLRIREAAALRERSEKHTSELQSLMRISYAVFCLTQKKKHNND